MFRVIPGARHFDMAPGSYHMVAAPREAPPFKVDGMVREEDTFLVLSAPKTVLPSREPLIGIMTRVIETRPRKPGTVIVRGKKPLELLAIIHDLNQSPTWKETWISRALCGVFKIAEEQGLHSIAIPVLVHGTLDGQTFMMLLGSALKDVNPALLKRIWLIIPSEMGIQTLEMLKNALGKSFGA